ncbi:MAG: metal-dependent transcriptional regulator [Actinomycetaceae bacterium]|nr:metal-dependent transcriptional regulator [Actinomycetaceae bacterium]MDO5746992.1 metal-dependent transcriptional regulator [Actinomycetaceae bacterium]
MAGLIDTTEMYLKTVWEMQEDSVSPLRARIVDRLGHSGPTVSQTVARMERDGLLRVGRDRRIELSKEGLEIATKVIRKHRLAECLLLDIVKLDWTKCHDEACRWEHVISDDVVGKLVDVLGNPQYDPYGNPIPGSGGKSEKNEIDVELVVGRDGGGKGKIVRIGEPNQAEPHLLEKLLETNIVPGTIVDLSAADRDVRVTNVDTSQSIVLTEMQGRHLFVVTKF